MDMWVTVTTGRCLLEELLEQVQATLGGLIPGVRVVQKVVQVRLSAKFHRAMYCHIVVGKVDRVAVASLRMLR